MYLESVFSIIELLTNRGNRIGAKSNQIGLINCITLRISGEERCIMPLLLICTVQVHTE